METLYTVSKTRLGADCGSGHELLIDKFRLKLKKVGKTARPFRYDLNQIPYDYTVEVRNRFKGLDLMDRVPDEVWMEVRDIEQETGIKTILMEKKCKKQNGRTKANRVLPRECTGHSKHPLPTTQEKTLHMDTTRWSTMKSD